MWTFIVELKPLENQIILGVEKPIPRQAPANLLDRGTGAGFLDRDGTTLLFPAFPVSQWAALASWSAAAEAQESVVDTLLVRHNVHALYDTVLHFQGDNIDPVKLINHLDFALADRYRCVEKKAMLIYRLR